MTAAGTGWQDGVAQIMEALGATRGMRTMSNVINLRQARKNRARADKSRMSDENRARFGRTKAQRQADAEEEQRRNNILNGARLDRQDEE